MSSHSQQYQQLNTTTNFEDLQELMMIKKNLGAKRSRSSGAQLSVKFAEKLKSQVMISPETPSKVLQSLSESSVENLIMPNTTPSTTMKKQEESNGVPSYAELYGDEPDTQSAPDLFASGTTPSYQELYGDDTTTPSHEELYGDESSSSSSALQQQQRRKKRKMTRCVSDITGEQSASFHNMNRGRPNYRRRCSVTRFSLETNNPKTLTVHQAAQKVVELLQQKA